MTIGLVLPALPAYSETFFRNKITGLQDRGMEVILFVNGGTTLHSYLNCKVHQAPTLHGSLFLVAFNALMAFIKAMVIHPKKSFKLFTLNKREGVGFKKNIKQVISNQFLLNERVDWLHFGFGTMALGREAVAKAIGAKMAVSFRGFDITIYPKEHPHCYDMLWRFVDKVHVISNDISDLVYREGFKDQAPLVKITPAINPHLFSRVHPGAVNEKTLHILTVARLHWKKGLKDTLEALALLKQDGVDFQYTIIGSGSEEDALKRACFELGIEDQVHFKGAVSHQTIKSEMEQVSLYIQYSLHEGFCNAVLEAQAMGLLCIVSDAEGLSENVLHEHTGWVVPKAQPTALYHKIKDVMALGEQDKARISTQSVKRVQETFNLEKQIQEFIRFYEKD